MIASILRLSRSDIKALRITDAYSLHRVVYDLYEDIRTDLEKKTSVSSGILYVDKGSNRHGRNILMLSKRPPRQPDYGEVESKTIPDSFLRHEHYGFEVTVNPSKRDKNTGKIVAIRGRDAVTQWFINKAPTAWGFTVKAEHLQIQGMSVKIFQKQNHLITLGSASIKGELIVTNRDHFIQSFQRGIGRSSAFGFGLLQAVPLFNPFKL